VLGERKNLLDWAAATHESEPAEGGRSAHELHEVTAGVVPVFLTDVADGRVEFATETLLKFGRIFTLVETAPVAATCLDGLGVLPDPFHVGSLGEKLTVTARAGIGRCDVPLLLELAAYFLLGDGLAEGTLGERD
jgi:hypothetical protein